MSIIGDLTVQKWEGAKSRGSWISEQEAAALYGLASMNPAHVVEVGCWQGGTSWLLSHAADRLTMIDPFTHRKAPLETALNNMAGRLGNTTILTARDHDIYPIWNGEISMLFLDHDHGTQSTIDSLRGWRPHLKTGAPVCIHNYGPKNKRRRTAEQIEAAVKEVAIEVCEVVDTLAICRWS